MTWHSCFAVMSEEYLSKTLCCCALKHPISTLPLRVSIPQANRSVVMHIQVRHTRFKDSIACCIHKHASGSRHAGALLLRGGTTALPNRWKDSFRVTVLLSTRAPGRLSGSTAKYPSRSSWNLRGVTTQDRHCSAQAGRGP